MALFARNEGALDRGLRVLAGGGLIAAALLASLPAPAWIVGAVGGVLLVTGVVGFCPAYRLLGVRTCPVAKSG